MEQLIRDAQAGDRESCEKLIRLFYNEIYAYVYKLTFDKELAMDLTQEVFIRVIKKISHYKPKHGSFKSWLYKVAHNYTINYFNTRDYKNHKNYIELAEQITTNINLDLTVIKQEDTKLINNAIYNLDSKYKDIIIMRYFQDLSINEIASILEINDNTVKTRLRRGLDKLKECLEGGDLYE
ncbi:MAG: polymerase subunit sigma [Haloplasmataceae bacterium]|jgi:RNA polymerase sigma-70 factor (ECF subfamily)|nr:polymerase subunit sigma [Haloplasmataceae bacterium]